jgi:adhesin/invasin
LDHFAISFIRSNQTAGQPFNFTVVAVDNLGGIMTGFNGMVNLTGTDGSSPLGNASMFSPQSYVYQNSDAGRHVFFATMFKAMRGATVTASGAGKTGSSNPFNVVPSAITKVTITPDNVTITANATVIATANATDAYGNPANSGFEWSISPTSGVATVTPTANTHSAAIRGANVSTVTTGTLTAKASGTSVSATAPVKVSP